MADAKPTTEPVLENRNLLVSQESVASSRPVRAFSDHKQVLFSAALAFVAGVVVSAMRRPNQFSWPAVWAEEGIYVLPQWLADGAQSIFRDLNGTYPLITRLLFGLNLELFPRHWTRANAIVAVAIVGLAAALIVAAPTVLKGRWMVVLLVLLIPTDAEVFGVLLYSFWWLSLLALISVLWDPGNERLALRVSLGWIGALSSPVGAFFGLLGFLRFAFTRTRNDLRAALLMLPASAVTLLLVATNPASAASTPLSIEGWADASDTAGVILGKFLGAWTWSPSGFDDVGTVQVALGIIALVLVVWALVSRPTEWMLWLLAAGTGGAIAATVLRVTPTILHPFAAGPRYFFFAYVLLAMLIVQIALLPLRSSRDLPLRVGASLLVAVALVNIAILTVTNGLGNEMPEHFGFRRYHAAYDWSEQLDACVDGAGIGVFTDGAAIYEFIEVSAEDCARLK